LSTTTHKKTIARLALATVLAAGAISAPVATADTGQPQQGGGCHMVFSSGTTGLNQMMANASGTGAHNMVAMLSKFSSQQFCGA
jgi:hypothetical protein